MFTTYNAVLMLPLYSALILIILSTLGIHTRLIKLAGVLCSGIMLFYATEQALFAQGCNIILQSSGYISYGLRNDAVSRCFILLTAIITFFVIIEGIVSVRKKSGYYFALFFILQFILNMFFCASGIILFYILFEAALVPMFFIIGFFGGKERISASYTFFLYTFAVSLPMLIALLYINGSGGVELHTMQSALSDISSGKINVIWWIIFCAFAVKIPLVPLHSWLPKAHVQAPTGGSMMLAGVLLKMGGYGMLRMLLPAFEEVSHNNSNIVMIISVVSIIYGSLTALGQKDIKSLVAYSSIAHMGYVTAGIFSNTTSGVDGAVFQMVSHGLVSAGLFAAVGMFFRRTGTMVLGEAFVSKMPKFATLFIILSLASMAVPGTSNFIGEVSIIAGLFENYKMTALILAFCVVLSAGYTLKLIKGVVWGMKNSNFCDISALEICIGFGISVLVLSCGIYPNIVFRLIH